VAGPSGRCRCPWGLHFLQVSSVLIQVYICVMGQEKFSKPPTGPWSVIVVDNVWHIVSIWVLWLLVR